MIGVHAFKKALVKSNQHKLTKMSCQTKKNTYFERFMKPLDKEATEHIDF